LDWENSYLKLKNHFITNYVKKIALLLSRFVHSYKLTKILQRNLNHADVKLNVT